MAESQVRVVFLGDSSKLKKEIDDVDGSVGKAEGGFGKLGAAIGGALAVGSVVSLGKGAFDAAIESQKIAAQTEAVIKSMGLTSTVTADRIGDLASALSKKNGVDDEAIQKGQNLLLTFGDLAKTAGTTGGAFDRASQIMVDMGAAMGTDASASAIQLGKALNDPTAGISALARVGVSFTDQQEKQIKTMQKAGDMAGAQKIILGELERQFGGSAAAQATATDRMKIAFGNLQEEIGAKLIPVIESVSSWVLGKGLPLFGRFASILGDKLGPILQEIQGSFRAFIAAFTYGDGEITSSGMPGFFERVGYWARLTFDYLRDNVPPVLDRLRDGFGTVVGVIRDDLVPAFERVFSFIRENWEVAIGAVTFGLIALAAHIYTTVIPALVAKAAAWWAVAAAAIAANWQFVAVAAVISALVAGVIYAYRNFETFRNVVDAVAGFITGTVAPAFMALGRYLSDHIPPIIATVVGVFRDHLIPAFQATISFIVDNIFPVIADFVRVVATIATKVFEVAGDVQRVLFDIFGFFVALGTGIANVISSIVSTLAGWVNEVWKYGGMVLDFFREIPDKIGDFFGGLAEAITSPFRAAFNAIAGLWNRTVGSLSFSVPGWVPGIGGRGWDVPDIPTFHTGGIVPGSGDVLSMLKGGEGVFTREQMAAMGRGGGNVINITVNGSRSPQATADTVARTLMSSQVRVALAGA